MDSYLCEPIIIKIDIYSIEIDYLYLFTLKAFGTKLSLKLYVRDEIIVAEKLYRSRGVGDK